LQKPPWDKLTPPQLPAYGSTPVFQHDKRFKFADSTILFIDFLYFCLLVTLFESVFLKILYTWQCL